MAGRASNEIVASLIASDLAHALVSQVVIEQIGASGSAGNVRASTLLIDALPVLSGDVRASWIIADALVWVIDPWSNRPFDGEAAVPSIYPELPGLTYSVIKRPKFFTGVATAPNGREVRISYASTPLWEWDLSYEYLPDWSAPGAATPSDFKQLLGFYLSMQGSFGGFMFRDPDDNTVVGQVIGIGDDATTAFTLVRTFGGSDGTGTEPVGGVDVDRPFAVYFNGVLQDPSVYDVATTQPVGQLLRFHSPPASGVAITADFSYFFYVRFKDDHYDFEKFMDQLWSQRQLTLMSMRG